MAVSVSGRKGGGGSKQEVGAHLLNTSFRQGVMLHGRNISCVRQGPWRVRKPDKPTVGTKFDYFREIEWELKSSQYGLGDLGTGVAPRTQMSWYSGRQSDLGVRRSWCHKLVE